MSDTALDLAQTILKKTREVLTTGKTEEITVEFLDSDKYLVIEIKMEAKDGKEESSEEENNEET